MDREEVIAQRSFYRGYTAALASLSQWGEDTIYDHAVFEGEAQELVARARKDGAMRWSGLSGYVRRQRTV